jgi:lysine 2,3-aminomutase
VKQPRWSSPALFPNARKTDWENWRWQMANRITGPEGMHRVFPRMSPRMLAGIAAHARLYQFALTPFVLSLIQLDQRGNPRHDDPIWRQVGALPPGTLRSGEYDGKSINWEIPGELPTPLLHHKYPDRAIIRMVDHCFCYCNYCYLTGRILDLSKKRARSRNLADWKATLAYLRLHGEIRDVLVSGGDPLILDNPSLERLLRNLKEIRTIKTVRINTRVFSYNPFRVDPELAHMFAKYQVTALEMHLAHPRELTPECDRALDCLDSVGWRPLILWRAPLLAGVNDDPETLEHLLIELYRRRITPYYIFHYAPFSLGRHTAGVPLEAGRILLASLRRRIPGPAFPRYTLFHQDGKHDIPLERGGNAEFRYLRDRQGRQFVRFKNWRGRWVSYSDS